MSSRVISRITGAPWLIQSEALGTIIEVASRGVPDEAALAAWKNDAAREALATRQGDRLGNSPSAKVRDGIAIIPVAGPIFRYSNLFTAFSGATSLGDLAENLQAAMSDSRVRGILLEIDSPGGEATGIDQAAALVADAARLKPTVAFVEGYAMSAAYWLASAAGEIVISSTGMVGSLGAVFNIADRTEAESKAGMRRYRIVSTQTPNKLFDPGTETGAAKLQALADRLADEFLGAAAANRGLTVEELLAASDGGGSLMGADAVAVRLGDSVGGFEETLARLAAGDAKLRTASKPKPPSATGPAPRATTMEHDMKTMPDAPAPAPDAATEQPTAPASAAAPAPTPAAAAPAPQPEADANPVVAERARCAAINAAAKPGQQALATLAIDEGWSVETFNRAQAANETAVTQARTEAAAGGFRDSLPTPLADAGGADNQADEPEAKWKNEFATDAKLRAEFGTEGAYVAYRLAEAAGKVRSIKRA